MYNSIAERWDLDPICESLPDGRRLRNYSEVRDIIATTLTQSDTNYKRTNAEREALWIGWGIAQSVDKSGRAAQVEHNPTYSFAPLS